MDSQDVAEPADWESIPGLERLDQLARDNLRLPGELRDWQRLGAARLLNGKDVLLLASTGLGKSTLFQLYALARPKDTVVVVSPLKMLENNMVSSLVKKNIQAVALNADAISAAQKAGENLWARCAQGHYQIILCSPERLASPEMVELLSKQSFIKTVTLVVVDEVHLIPIWGGDGSGYAFRSAFNAIGSLKSRLHSRTKFLALSGTLMPGKPTRIVKERLGLEAPKFYFMKLDCGRDNLHIILRRIQHAFTQGSFLDLDHLVPVDSTCAKDIKKSVIYVDNVTRGHQLVVYLCSLLPLQLKPLASKLIRHVHASTCPQCKDEALEEFEKTEGCQLRIIVTTDVFGCGVDIPDIEQVINFGTPRNLDSSCQRGGRAGRGIPDGYSYTYVNPKLWDSMEVTLGIRDRSRAKRSRSTQDEDGALDSDDEPQGCKYFNEVLKAHLTRRCLARTIDGIYGNSVQGKPDRCGKCSGCIDDEAPKPREVQAMDETIKNEHQNDASAPTTQTIVPLKGYKKPTGEILDDVRVKIVDAARDIWLSTPVYHSKYPFDSLRTFLPAAILSTLARRLVDLQTSELIHQVLGADWKFWEDYGEEFVSRVLGIRNQLLEKVKLSVRSKGKRTQVTIPMAATEDETDEGAESEDLDMSCPLHNYSPPSLSISRKRRAESYSNE